MNIYNYFTEDIEYPKYCNGEILPFNTVYSEVSSTFLNAFINGCEKHLLCYTLDNYRNNDEEKTKYVEDININGYKGTHTSLSEIEDDIFIVSKIKDGYILFWYHLSGRCDVGRFKTEDNIEQIENSLINWLEEMKYTEFATGYTKILTDKYLKGWVGF